VLGRVLKIVGAWGGILGEGVHEQLVLAGKKRDLGGKGVGLCPNYCGRNAATRVEGGRWI